MNILLITAFFWAAFAQEETPDFPAYTQQCEDDAGPPWVDDLDTFGQGKYYWSDSFAQGVMNQDGSCPAPIAAACESRSTPLQAFLEGPISCSAGWYCRILPQETHGKGSALDSDFNFMHCDQPITEETFTDISGHCHGGSDPTTFYWWVRDHWHRGYAGRLKCCCDWPPRGIANRCDYRAMIPQGMADQCRDANEEHTGPGSGMSYGFEEGCPENNVYTEPADDKCWEILNFGPAMAGETGTITAQSVGPAAPAAGSATRGSENFAAGVYSGPNAGPYTGPTGTVTTGSTASTSDPSVDSTATETTASTADDNTDDETDVVESDGGDNDNLCADCLSKFLASSSCEYFDQIAEEQGDDAAVSAFMSQLEDLQCSDCVDDIYTYCNENAGDGEDDGDNEVTCDAATPCVAGTFCNYDNDTSGFCEPCMYSEDECMNDGLPEAGAQECVSVCVSGGDNTSDMGGDDDVDCDDCVKSFVDLGGCDAMMNNGDVDSIVASLDQTCLACEAAAVEYCYGDITGSDGDDETSEADPCAEPAVCGCMDGYSTVEYTDEQGCVTSCECVAMSDDGGDGDVDCDDCVKSFVGLGGCDALMGNGDVNAIVSSLDQACLVCEEAAVAYCLGDSTGSDGDDEDQDYGPCDAANPCVAGTFCNYDDEPSGFCEPCMYSEDECWDAGLPDAGAMECVSVCVSVDTSDAGTDGGEEYEEGSFGGDEYEEEKEGSYTEGEYEEEKEGSYTEGEEDEGGEDCMALTDVNEQVMCLKGRVDMLEEQLSDMEFMYSETQDVCAQSIEAMSGMLGGCN